MTPPNALSPDAQALLGPWPAHGLPHLGGLPPYDHATPAALEEAFDTAIETKRDAVRRIARNAEPPTFDNTVAALEDCGRPLRHLQALFIAVSSTASVGDMPAVAQRLAPRVPALELEIAHDPALFARIDAVWKARQASALDAQQIRLVEVLRERLVRAGAALAAPGKARLADINERLATLSAQYRQNLIAEPATQALWLDSEADLAGLPGAQRRSAADAAKALGREGRWAIPNQRPAVWPFLIHSTRRDLREKVWRMWDGRCDHDGAHDNRPIAAEMLRLRGERARLLGHASHAHGVLAERMVRTPQTAMTALRRTWDRVLAATQRQVADYQAIADAEAAGEPGITLAPWDRQHYAEKLRRQRFDIDGEVIRQYLPLERMLEAMFWAAGRLHGLAFSELRGVPVLHPSIRVFEVRRDSAADAAGATGAAIGVLYVDLFHRPGKMHGSHQHLLRAAEHFAGRVLPISNMVSGLPPPGEGEPVLLPWEYANVLFHEFGHSLHMLLDGARYPSLGSLNVAWDFVELPSLLNEYWLRDRALLARFARHHATGEPMPAALLDRLEAALKYDRIFSVNLDYLGGAIVDLKLHLLADGSGRDIDPQAVEREILAALGLPACWDQILRVTNSFHSFVGSYDAGVYSYLWSDMMAADVAEAFLASPGGLYDERTAQAWREQLLTVGHTVPADEAFRRFRGRDPDPEALMRRFGLAETAPA
ncbi:MAG: M3 family metallopeptidase [Rubrivivax sp.]|nr:M3 family metallopeptidase [Rubrivivax sp.]